MTCTGESLPYFLLQRRPHASVLTVVSTRARLVVSIGRLNQFLLADGPYIIRYFFDAEDKAALRKLPAREVSVWARLIIGVGQ
jgi:hypothetical protein